MKTKSLSRVRLILLVFMVTIFSISFFDEVSRAEYPDRPLSMVVTFNPGGDTDTTARLIANKLPAHLGGQAVVVLNKPGGGGVIGVMGVLATPADGYTILAATTPNLTAPHVMKDVRYELLKNFKPISLAVVSPMLLVVKGDSPWQTLEDFTAAAKKNPGKLTYAIPGPASASHMTGELFKMYSKTDITGVPQDGTGPAIANVLGGHIDCLYTEVGLMGKYIEAGSLRALAITSKNRNKLLPNVPTMVEKGYADFVTYSILPYLVRAETPPDIVEKLGKAFKAALSDKELLAHFAKLGFEVVNLGPTEADEWLRNDLKMRIEVIEKAKMSVQ